MQPTARAVGPPMAPRERAAERRKNGEIMAHTLTNLLLHVIFGTKGREPSIDEDVPMIARSIHDD